MSDTILSRTIAHRGSLRVRFHPSVLADTGSYVGIRGRGFTIECASEEELDRFLGLVEGVARDVGVQVRRSWRGK